MNDIRPIHPFPARMAPEIVFTETAALPAGSIILDPMTGSGTSVRVASEQGHRAIGFDLDPLAAMMARAWTTPVHTRWLRERAELIVRAARGRNADSVDLPWIDNDTETTNFIDYWFANPQKDDLRKICSLLVNERGALADTMMIALSRTIITKSKGASLAWDVAHSRPHKVRETNNFDVLSEFMISVNEVAKRLESQPPPGNVEVGIADARHLNRIEDTSVDAVITSPPYLNAIDYMRGHKLALVWFGHRICELRSTRSQSIGSEKNPDTGADIRLANQLIDHIGDLEVLPSKERGIVRRYSLDIFEMVREIHRVLRTNGKAVFVVGNSCLRGVFIQNSLIVTSAARRLRLRLQYERVRELPTNKRYLPPPTDTEQSDLNKRMRTESILTFIKRQ